jgi:hypothetical protein
VAKMPASTKTPDALGEHVADFMTKPSNWLQGGACSSRVSVPTSSPF